MDTTPQITPQIMAQLLNTIKASNKLESSSSASSSDVKLYETLRKKAIEKLKDVIHNI